jgi:peptidoglycan-N-acetylglucosamine deacetylase
MLTFYRTPYIFRKLFPERVWVFSCLQPTLFLTFDDGPTQELTPWILKTLANYNAKGTFFCVGENVVKNPELFNQILTEKHTVGNHTMHHLNGWKTRTPEYVENVLLANTPVQSKLFRPPYGKLKRKQEKELVSKGFKTIMWSYLTYDFSSSHDMNNVFHKFIKSYKSGDIIVLHDNLKAEKSLKQFLPKLLEWGTKKGITFSAID